MQAGPIIEVVADGNPGGGTTAVLGLCQDLKRFLHRDIVLVTQKDSYAFQQGKALGLTVHGLDFFRARYDPALKARLASLMLERGPALVHAHGGRAAHALIGGERNWPLVYTVHGYHFPAKIPLIRPVFRLAEARIARDVDHIIFVSEADRKIAVTNRLLPVGGRASVIYNGIDPNQLGPNDEVERDNVILFLARMHRQKNPARAIEMMAHLRDLPLRLLMIGGGNLEGQMHRLVEKLQLQKSVTILGARSRNEALSHLRRAKMMVLPSIWEGLPIAPMEALYFGVPVIASSIPGTDEVITDGYNGLLVDNPTAERIAIAVRRLHDDQALWGRLSAYGRTDVLKRFSRAANSTAHMTLYESLTYQGT